MNISVVKEVLGVATKKDGSELRGVGKKGEWIMYSIILENGTKMNVFGPVAVGDTVYNLEQDPQYHTWKGQVKQAGSSQQMTQHLQDVGQPTNAQILNAILEVKALLVGDKNTPLKQADVILSQEDEDLIDGTPIDLSGVPF